MDVRRPVNENGATPAYPSPAPAKTPGSSNMLSKALSVVLILAALTFMSYYAHRAYSNITADSGVKGKQFQALFLTNGQVYFGKLAKVDSGYVKLTNIYYLQVQQQVQPSSSSSSTDNSNQQVSLAKLGNELHGPEDVMYVSRTQVLFWENLKNDGKVVQAIQNYQAQNGSSK